MTWKQKAEEWGGANLSFLSVDGEVLDCYPFGEPEKLEGTFRGKANERVACPVATEDGFSLLIIGKRLFRKISKMEPYFDSHVIRIVRQGAEGDPNTTYDVSKIDDPDRLKHLKEIAKTEGTKAAVAEALKDAKETVAR